MWRVGIDLRVLDGYQPGVLSGIPRSVYCLARELIRSQNEHYCLIGESSPPGLESAEWLRYDLPRSNLDLGERLESLIGFLHRFDLLLSPYYPIPARRTFRAAIMLYDVIGLRHPEWFAKPEVIRRFFDEDIRRSVDQCDCVIVNSEHTRRDVCELYECSAERVRVIPLAPLAQARYTEFDQPSINRVLYRYGVCRPYILSLCTLEPRKNLSRLVDAFSRVRSEYRDPLQLVLAGGLGWGPEELQRALDKSPVRDEIRITGFIEDQDLPLLYAAAEVFVYPSLYEGFGLPVLEAMAFGAAVVTSGVTSLPEVVGDAGEYCDPLDTDSIAAAILRVLLDQNRKRDLADRAIQRAQLFSWEKSARTLHEVLQQCLAVRGE